MKAGRKCGGHIVPLQVWYFGRYPRDWFTIHTNKKPEVTKFTGAFWVVPTPMDRGAGPSINRKKSSCKARNGAD
ncbi:hypothetical protein FOXYSP1_08977 [Fusarium oxysporum f. sp. phaseoli]